MSSDEKYIEEHPAMITFETMVSQINAAVGAERERCAKAAEEYWRYADPLRVVRGCSRDDLERAGQQIAAKIRSGE